MIIYSKEREATQDVSLRLGIEIKRNKEDDYCIKLGKLSFFFLLQPESLTFVHDEKQIYYEYRRRK